VINITSLDLRYSRLGNPDVFGKHHLGDSVRFMYFTQPVSTNLGMETLSTLSHSVAIKLS
jgi:hypothetical protein